MNDAVELRDLGDEFRRRWLIPAVLAVAGVVLGMFVADRVAPLYRAQGSLLVGPINGTVTRSTTLRASESLATFYADIARRQVVLGPVAGNLRLSMSWTELRNEVSAVVADQNPRLLTVTVADSSKARAVQIAGAIVNQLVALSPAPSNGGAQAFVSQQVASLQATIEQGEAQVDRLHAALVQETDAKARAILAQRLSNSEEQVNEWRHTYVELMAVDPTSDAGGLQVMDDVRSVTSLDRAGAVRQAALGGGVGAVLGLLLVWLLSGFDRRQAVLSVQVPNPKVKPRREARPPHASTAARQAVVVPAGARSPGRGT